MDIYNACSKGKLALVKKLVKSGTDLQKPDNVTAYPLDYACNRGHFEIVKYLTQHGADVTADNSSAVRAVVLLDVFINGETIDNYCISDTSMSDRLKIVKYLVNLGADARAKKDLAVTWACENGNIELVKYLISIGADITAGKDRTLRSTIINKQYKMFDFLIKFVLGEMKSYTLLLLLNKKRMINRDLIKLVAKPMYIKSYALYQKKCK